MWETYEEAPLEDIPINDGTFIDITALRTLVAEVRECGWEVAIATLGRRDVAEKAMQHAFGSCHGINISTPADVVGARSAFTQGAMLGDKNFQLLALADRFNVTGQQIKLLDDQARNIQQAVKAGMQAKHVPSGLTRQVVEQVREALENLNDPEPGSEASGYKQHDGQWHAPWSRLLNRGRLVRSRQVDGQKWVTAQRHSYSSLLEDSADVGAGQHARVLKVVRECPEGYFGRLFNMPCSLDSNFEMVHAWKMYVSSVEALLDGELDRKDAVEPEVQPRYKRLCQLSRRGLLPHSLMPTDTKPTVFLDPTPVVAKGDSRLPLDKLRMGMIFTLMDGDARAWLGTETPASIRRSFAKSMLEAIIALRKTGYVHGDLKLENVLFRGHDSPEWWLNDFDFVTPVHGPTPDTPPMRDLVTLGLRTELHGPVIGVEDFFSFVLVYSEFDPEVTKEQQQEAFSFISKDASAMADFRIESFPTLGVFNAGSLFQ